MMKIAAQAKIPAPVFSSADEDLRMHAVHRYGVLDSPPDAAFDRITAMAARLFQAPIALITIVDSDRIWFKSHHGIDVSEAARESGLCASAILQNEPYVVRDALSDPRTRANPLVTGALGVRFYAAAPLTTSDGFNLGTLCVIDRKPCEISKWEISHLQDLAALVMDQLELRSTATQAMARVITAKSSAEKASRAKSDFISSMSHELRSPLNAILGFAQLMESDPAPQTVNQKENTGQILQAGWYLLDLINEILDLALIESGKLSLSSEPMSLNEVLQECEAMMQPQARRYDVTLNFCRLDEPCFVHADRLRVKQALINLLSNAVKYNHAGGSVTVECSVRAPDLMRIGVRDTGPGLSVEGLAQLFQPFNRLGREASGEEGTGIGLVMTKRLVELMNGKVGVESTLGAGTEFWIELHKTAPPPAAQGVQQRLALVQHEPAQSQVFEILYIEDSLANLSLVEQIVSRRQNLRLLSARNATLGIRLAREHQPAVILMDISLPGINGITAMQMLRKDPLTRHIPVVAVSANAIPADIRRGIEAGFFGYLTKPINVKEFMSTLDRVLEFSATIKKAGKKGAAP